MGSKASRDEKDDENDDQETGTSAHVMIAGAEAVTAAAKKEKNEENDNDVHECVVVWGRVEGVRAAP